MWGKIKLFVAVGLVMATTCACGNFVRASQYNSDFLNVKITTSEIKADIVVGEKITGTATLTTFLGIFTIEKPTKFADGVTYGAKPDKDKEDSTEVNFFTDTTFENLKAAAAYDAITNSDADIIIAPRYEIQRDSSFLICTTKAIVTGYKGKIKSIKNVDKP